jgi:transposase
VANQLHALRVTAPDELREELRGLSLARLSLRASRFRVPSVVDTPLAATRLALRSLAQRFRQLSAEVARLDVQLARLVAAAAPQLVARPGIGTQIAAQLLVTAGDNPTRLRSEGAFAMLVGTALIPASSGKTDRQRLNRAGDRQANSALYMLALSRLSRDPRTQAYVRRRTAEGKTKPEIMRCLKRYLTREVYRLLVPRRG